MENKYALPSEGLELKKKTFEQYKEVIESDIKEKGFSFFDRKVLDKRIVEDEKRGFIGKLEDYCKKHFAVIKVTDKDVSGRIFIIYDKKQTEPVKVESVNGFLKEVFKYKSDTVNRYFRGQKAWFDLKPSLFRYNERVENEMELNARVYNDRPGDFADCQSTFDKLVKLKHYVHPSRLLDLSSSPLVSLFFACFDSTDNEADDTGIVLEAYCRKKDEKISVSSDTVVMLTAMTNTRLNLKEEDRKEILPIPCKEENNSVKNICPKKDGTSCYHECWPNKNEENGKTDEQKDVSGGNDTQQGDKTGEKANERPKLNDVFVKDSWAKKYIGELCHQCKKEGMSIYWDDVCFNELNQCILVKPPLNNDRIVRQQGCFIMCGMNPDDIYSPPSSLYSFFEYKDDSDQTDDETVDRKKKRKGKSHFYYVLPSKKQVILDELRVLGLDEYYFFPELEREIKVVSALSGTVENPQAENTKREIKLDAKNKSRRANKTASGSTKGRKRNIANSGRKEETGSSGADSATGGAS